MGDLHIDQPSFDSSDDSEKKKSNSNPTTETHFSETKRNHTIIWNNSNRAKILIVVFWIIILSGMLSIYSDLLELDLLKRIEGGTDYTLEELDANDSRQSLIAIFYTVISIISIVVFLNWFRRAYGNLHRLKIKNLNESESSAVWYWFIPILNLYKPVKIMSEIHSETLNFISKKGTIKSGGIIPFLITVWWVLHIVVNVISNIVLRYAWKSDDSVSSMINSTESYIFTEAFTIIEALIVILMVYKISQNETELARQVKSQGGMVLNK
ncbi:MAG: DUF4328 domain-containing protein [Nonlabens sp.]